ncbi:hypothetical protein FCM35_KLT01712 [Carex littledalei]|uniref:Uncharacterized protein n=1 Tax=Carex littledalei TaxID=544730 RepID=A0A833R6H9_9POAL|nr:hypothetical protein FCM35_KLT01712 [Carex littledalei]
MAGICSSFPVKFFMNPLKMVFIAEPLARLGWIQAHGLQVSDTIIFNDMPLLYHTKATEQFLMLSKFEWFEGYKIFMAQWIHVGMAFGTCSQDY